MTPDLEDGDILRTVKAAGRVLAQGHPALGTTLAAGGESGSPALGLWRGQVVLGADGEFLRAVHVWTGWMTRYNPAFPWVGKYAVVWWDATRWTALPGFTRVSIIRRPCWEGQHWGTRTLWCSDCPTPRPDPNRPTLPV